MIFKMFIFVTLHNNYVVSTIYKLRPIQLMGAFVYSLYLYILYPAKLEIRRLLYRN